jgi:hypothetical protein
MPRHAVRQLASACCHHINKTLMLVLVSDCSHACLGRWSLSKTRPAVCATSAISQSMHVRPSNAILPCMVSVGCRANKAGLTVWMRNGGLLLMGMLLKCCTLKGTPSHFPYAIAQSVHVLSLVCSLTHAMHRLPACLPACSCTDASSSVLGNVYLPAHALMPRQMLACFIFHLSSVVCQHPTFICFTFRTSDIC